MNLDPYLATLTLGELEAALKSWLDDKETRAAIRAEMSRRGRRLA